MTSTTETYCDKSVQVSKCVNVWGEKHVVHFYTDPHGKPATRFLYTNKQVDCPRLFTIHPDVYKGTALEGVFTYLPKSNKWLFSVKHILELAGQPCKHYQVSTQKDIDTLLCSGGLYKAKRGDICKLVDYNKAKSIRKYCNPFNTYKGAVTDPDSTNPGTCCKDVKDRMQEIQYTGQIDVYSVHDPKGGLASTVYGESHPRAYIPTTECSEAIRTLLFQNRAKGKGGQAKPTLVMCEYIKKFNKWYPRLAHKM